MLNANGRGKAYTNEVLNWAVQIHDLDYIFTDERENEVIALPEEVERVLKRIARNQKATNLMLSLYSTARVYRLYYSAEDDDKRRLLDELYENANTVLKRILK